MTAPENPNSGGKEVQFTAEQGRCVVEYPREDTTSSFDRWFGEQHLTFRREIRAQDRTKEPEAKLVVNVDKSGVLTTGQAKFEFAVEGKIYEVQKKLTGPKLFEKNGTANRELNDPDSPDYKRVLAAFAKYDHEFYKLEKCESTKTP